MSFGYFVVLQSLFVSITYTHYNFLFLGRGNCWAKLHNLISSGSTQLCTMFWDEFFLLNCLDILVSWIFTFALHMLKNIICWPSKVNFSWPFFLFVKLFHFWQSYSCVNSMIIGEWVSIAKLMINPWPIRKSAR